MIMALIQATGDRKSGGRNRGSQPSHKFLLHIFQLREGLRGQKALDAELALAEWVLQYSHAFDYDNADKRDALLLVREALNTNPKRVSEALRK
jgi:hypothetical protein